MPDCSAIVSHSTRSLAHNLAELCRRQELFCPRSNRPLPSVALRQARSVWFGVGLSGRSVTRGLPIDVMILVYAQELVRRQLGLGQSEILVADTNAVASGRNPLDVRRSAMATLDTLTTVTTRLGFPVHVQLASSLSTSVQAKRLMEHGHVSNIYVAQQLAQMEAMQLRGATIKLGWRLTHAYFDEALFDRAYQATSAPALGYVYTIGGRTLNPRRPRSCPYLCEDPQTRLLLQPTDRAIHKLERANPAAAAGYRRLLGKLARAHTRLVGTSVDQPERLAEQLLGAPVSV